MINEKLERTFPSARTLDLPGGHGGVLVSRDRFLPQVRQFFEGIH